MKRYAIVAFSTTYDAFAFNAACLKRGVDGALITIPRELSAGCGYAWKTPAESADMIVHLLHEENLEHESITEMDMD